MKESLPTRAFREHSELAQLKRQAKELLDAFRADDATATSEVRTHYRDADLSTFALHDAQLVLARAYGFASWPKLKAFVDGVTAKMNKIVAAFAGRLSDALGDAHDVCAPIFDHPRFERLEMGDGE